MIFLFGLNLEERGWEERPSVQLYISYSKIAIYLSLVDLSQVAGLQPPQVSQHIHVSCATHVEKISDRGVSCMSWAMSYYGLQCPCLMVSKVDLIDERSMPWWTGILLLHFDT